MKFEANWLKFTSMLKPSKQSNMMAATIQPRPRFGGEGGAGRVSSGGAAKDEGVAGGGLPVGVCGATGGKVSSIAAAH